MGTTLDTIIANTPATQDETTGVFVFDTCVFINDMLAVINASTTPMLPSVRDTEVMIAEVECGVLGGYTLNDDGTMAVYVDSPFSTYVLPQSFEFDVTY